MTLKDAADLATALTLIVATVTFVFALVEHRQREHDKRNQNWQKVVVYKIIEDGASHFDDIKIRYVTEAQQLTGLDIPKDEIQDSALKLALMGLISEHLISKSADDGAYVINTVSMQENQFRTLAFAQFQRQLSQNRLITRLYETLEIDGGKYTIDQLYRTFEAEKLGYSFEDFNVFVRDKIDHGPVMMDPIDHKLSLRSKMPQKPPAQQQKQP